MYIIFVHEATSSHFPLPMNVRGIRQAYFRKPIKSENLRVCFVFDNVDYVIRFVEGNTSESSLSALILSVFRIESLGFLECDLSPLLYFRPAFFYPI